uniref:Sec-independent protein translocase protein TatB n=1 Tax=Kalanchoe fedtschenkoi TaxID=63787 RepID=A0A7N0UEE0_KALFE
MLGISYGEWFVIMGAAAALIGPKDLPRIARTLGRLAGRSIGYVQMARGQLDSVMQQSQARQVHKELQDTMSQLEAIRHEIRGLSMLNPGPMTKSFMEKTLDSSGEADATSEGPEKRVEDKSLPEVPKVADSVVESSVTTNMVSKATAYARLAEAAANAKMKSATEVDKQYVDSGLLSVFPVSAESAGLLPKLKGIIPFN